MEKIPYSELQFKFKFTEKDEMPAAMILIIGQFEIRGFAIRMSKFKENSENFFLTVPKRSMGHNNWVAVFFTKPKEEWKKFEKAVLRQFHKEHDEFLEKELNERTKDLVL